MMMYLACKGVSGGSIKEIPVGHATEHTVTFFDPCLKRLVRMKRVHTYMQVFETREEAIDYLVQSAITKVRVARRNLAAYQQDLEECCAHFGVPIPPEDPSDKGQAMSDAADVLDSALDNAQEATRNAESALEG